MNNYEILAPVGANEQLKAAVRCGANAVYMGTSNFNARNGAISYIFKKRVPTLLCG